MLGAVGTSQGRRRGDADGVAPRRITAKEGSVNEGERLGKYKVRQELEPGLWLAERVEDFEQQVAVALNTVAADPASHAQFLERRRRLGAMHHQAIPRLLDSGETAAGAPYLLFEFIPAEPALAVARTEKWPLARRVALAIEYLEALEAAHGNLAAHGKLTVEDFRVSSAGQARLAIFPLEVGEADPAAADLSAAVRFLSSLIADAALPHLPGDLRAILNKANCAEPAKAYRSANSLAADLMAFLARKPVSARRATPAYRAGLFARRRPELFYPALVLAVSFLMATIYSIAQDSAARHSRDQAQSRLRQMQQLTYSLESDIFEPVSKLPNSKAARETLIRWTAESLDGLATQAGDDLQLRAQLAKSYGRLAQMQRADGDAAGAVAAEQRARAMVGRDRAH
jgi:serine/threonine-protein kinase